MVKISAELILFVSFSRHPKVSLFQALGSWGRAKKKRASERKNALVLPRCFSRSPFFCRSSVTTESLEQATQK